MFKTDEQERITLEEAARRVEEAARPFGILVVESDPDQQWRAARMLTLEGHRVVGTGSGEGALALLSHWPVDLVMVSENLTGMDGIEVAHLIAEVSPETPVVLVVEEGARGHAAASLVGAAACLTKPFRLDAIRDLLSSLGLGPGLAAVGPMPASVAPAE